MSTRNRFHVLIVDDELLIRQGIKHYLDWEQEGFTIVGEAANGREALELIEIADPHIILTDIVMPIMDGEELTRIVKEKYPHIEIIILSSFGEFDYVRSTFQSGVVDYILKPKLDAKTLLQALKKAAEKISTPGRQEHHSFEDPMTAMKHTIAKLLSGFDIPINREAFLQIFPNDEYCLAAVDFHDPPKIMEKLETAFTGKSINYVLHEDQNLPVIILNGKHGFQSEVKMVLSSAAREESGVGIVLSGAFTDFRQIGQVYKDSLLKLVNYRFFLSGNPVLTEKELPECPETHENFNLDRFTDEMKRRRFEEAFSYLEGHVKELSADYTKDKFEFKSFFGNIIFNITVLLSNLEYDVKELDQAKYAYFRLIEEGQTAEEIQDILARFIMEAKTAIHSGTPQAASLNMKKLTDYIREHYARQLTLTDVANHFHFNPSYLSSYFSANNNESFIEYLNKIRIEKAEELLIIGEAPISEISAMVGYADHSYFCKVFKRITGLSPSQFKRKHAKQ